MKRSPMHAKRKDTGPTRKVRLICYNRDGWRCACCGNDVMGKPHSLGHRKRRSQGGGNEMSNLLTFQGTGTDPGNPADHHARIDSRKDPDDEAKGYTCRSYQDPAAIPVMYFSKDGSGSSAYLRDDGTLDFEGAAA